MRERTPRARGQKKKPACAGFGLPEAERRPTSPRNGHFLVAYTGSFRSLEVGPPLRGFGLNVCARM